MVTYFNKKDLVDFGNYLLSNKRKVRFEERQDGLSIPERLLMVHDADIENFLDDKKKEKRK